MSTSNITPWGIRFLDTLPPAPPEIIPGLLPAEGVAYLAGPTNIGKSLVAIEIASALTTGTPLWGQLRAKRTIPKVFYLLGEHTAGTVHRLYRHTGLPMGKMARIIGPDQLPVPKQMVTQGQLNEETFAHYAQRVAGADLIIVDPLSAFIAGANAENDNAAMRHLVDAFSLLGQKQNCPVLILGHFGKPSRGKDGTEHDRVSYASRGASSAEDACATVFYMSAEAGQTFEIRCRKYKGETPPKYRLLRNSATKVHTLLTSKRPNVEAERIIFREKVDKLIAAGLDKSDAVKALTALDGVSERSAWRKVAAA